MPVGGPFAMGILLLVMLLGASPAVAKETLKWIPRFAPGIVSEKCLECICVVASGCRPVGCHYDVYSESCGYFQIKLPYWIDCNRPKPKQPCNGNEDCWKKCAIDEECSSACVQAYMKRYVDREPACHHNCESYARLHIGGPQGCAHRNATDAYWKKVQAAGCKETF